MATFKLPYIKEYVDCRGTVRRYFRRKGQKPAPLPGLPGSREFREAYEAALEAKRNIGATKSKPGSVAALVAAYHGSKDFRGLKPLTQATYKIYTEKFREEHGDKRVAMIERRHIRAMLEKVPTVGAANNVRAMLKRLMAYAVTHEWRDTDPTLGIKKLKPAKEGGYRAWTEADIAAFELAHDAGSRARMAMALLLYTAQRRADVVRMGWQHVVRDRISVRQSKTDARLTIPIHAGLRQTLADTPRTQMTFLLTNYGKPFSVEGFGNWFKECCREAGLMEHNCHGLRKAAARRLAEAGCTAHQIAAITGHKTLSEVQRYTEDAEQVMLAEQAMEKVR